MNANILSAVMQFLTPNLIAQMATALGLDRGTTQKAADAAVPAILTGLPSSPRHPMVPSNWAMSLPSSPRTR